MGNKCKASFVRESGYFLCSGTELTDQNRSSQVQYYALAVASTSFRKKEMAPSLLPGNVPQSMTTSPSSLPAQLLTGCLAKPTEPDRKTPVVKPRAWLKQAALLFSNSVTALAVIKYRDFSCGTSLPAQTSPSHSHEAPPHGAEGHTAWL